MPFTVDLVSLGVGFVLGAMAFAVSSIVFLIVKW